MVPKMFGFVKTTLALLETIYLLAIGERIQR